MSESPDDSARSQTDDLLGSFDQPMAIVTTSLGADRGGCLVGFHSQSGIDPPRYSVWLSKANRTYRLGVLAEVFAVHFPQADDHELAQRFGSETGDEVDKFAQCSWHVGPAGAPLLDGIDDWVVGRRVALLDAGCDHVCVVLDLIESARSGRTNWLHVDDVLGLTPGHEADERPYLD